MNANFPFGTFIANIVGTICLSVLFILGNGEVSTNIGCQVIAGLSDGFCGIRKMRGFKYPFYMIPSDTFYFRLLNDYFHLRGRIFSELSFIYILFHH